MSSLEFSFKHPTILQASGPSRCGKTRLVLRILEHKLIQPFPTRIIWVYSENQPDYLAAQALYPQIEFVHGWKEEMYISINPNTLNLLIVDDQMEEVGNSTSFQNLFSRGSHHRNLTIIYLLQNLYNPAKNQRTVSLNTHYNIIFKNPRDERQFRCLASQMHPGNSEWLIGAFKDATSQPHGYLELDHHPDSDDDKRVLTNILPGEELSYCSPE